MPNFNRKGPHGSGQLTGRKMGKCNPENKDKTIDEIIKMQGANFQNGQGLRRGFKQKNNQSFISRFFNIFNNTQQNGYGQGMGRGNCKKN